MSDGGEIETIMGRPIYYDREGNPLSREQWYAVMRQIHEEATEEKGYPMGSYKRVGEETLSDPDGNEHYVSTVWLGMDHAIDGPPLIFETMVFCHGHNCSWADFMWDRYSTVEEAEVGHRLAVEAVREGRQP